MACPTRQSNLRHPSNTTKAGFIALHLHPVNIERSRLLPVHLKGWLPGCDHGGMELNQLAANEGVLVLNEIAVIICLSDRPTTRMPAAHVRSLSHAVHPKWSTPSAVAYTQSCLHLEAWSAPPAVAYTQSGLHHEAWSAPPAVAYIQNGLHHTAWFTPKIVHHPATGCGSSGFIDRPKHLA